MRGLAKLLKWLLNDYPKGLIFLLSVLPFRNHVFLTLCVFNLSSFYQTKGKNNNKKNPLMKFNSRGAHQLRLICVFVREAEAAVSNSRIVKLPRDRKLVSSCLCVWTERGAKNMQILASILR